MVARRKCGGNVTAMCQLEALVMQGFGGRCFAVSVCVGLANTSQQSHCFRRKRFLLSPEAILACGGSDSCLRRKRLLQFRRRRHLAAEAREDGSWRCSIVIIDEGLIMHELKKVEHIGD